MNQVPRYIIIGIVMLFLLASLAQAKLQDGLVLYLPFDEGQGTVAKDLSGKNNNGAIKKAEWVNGQFGKALKFSADDTFVEVPFSDDFKITEGITLGAWATSNAMNNFRGIINARKTTFGPFLLQQSASGLGEFALMLAGSWKAAQSKGSLEKSAFHHLVGTYDQKDGMHFYFDGEISESLNQVPKGAGLIDVAPNEGIGIGHNYGMAGRFWDGVIDEVIIYNRALSADEVATLSKAPMPGAPVEPSGKLATAWGMMKKTY